MLEKCRSKFAWGLLLSKIEDDEGNRKDVLKNYRSITKENILAFENSYICIGYRQAPQTDQVITDLDLTTDATHKT